MDNIDIDIFTKHLDGCLFNEPIIFTVDGKKFKQSCNDLDSDDLCKNGNISKQDCHSKDSNGKIIMRCAVHYRLMCDKLNWSSDLSSCANTICDKMGLSYKDRSKINHKNIEKILGLSDDVKSRHVSDSLRKYVNKSDLTSYEPGTESETESDSETETEPDSEPDTEDELIKKTIDLTISDEEEMWKIINERSRRGRSVTRSRPIPMSRRNSAPKPEIKKRFRHSTIKRRFRYST